MWKMHPPSTNSKCLLASCKNIFTTSNIFVTNDYTESLALLMYVMDSPRKIKKSPCKVNVYINVVKVVQHNQLLGCLMRKEVVSQVQVIRSTHYPIFYHLNQNTVTNKTTICACCVSIRNRLFL